MGEVIAFKPKTGPPRPVAAPAPKRSLWDVWSNPAAWQVSRKGNPFVRITNFTTGRERDRWRCKDGWWSWCIAWRVLSASARKYLDRIESSWRITADETMANCR